MSRSALLFATFLGALLLLVGGAAAPASAHVIPTSTVILDIRADHIDAALRIPIDDLQAASNIELGTNPARKLPTKRAALAAYIQQHFQPKSATGGTWATTVSALAVHTSEQLGTGVYPVLTATVRLTPPAGASERNFDLGYDVVVHRVITHVVLVSVHSDWSAGHVGSAREIGTISLDSVTGEVPPLHVDLGGGSAWLGFVGMVRLGIQHILEGTDHQLFLLTLLLPAPLIASAGRWRRTAKPAQAVRKIAAITIAFTIGHSITLALGALGLPVPQHLVEALIAVSILVAAAHAMKPIFPGREALIACGFGLIHGLAFSATLRELDLSGGQLVLSLLGFNLGIEIMQLVVVALVLPPLILLARTRAYQPLRQFAATVAGIAAVAWLFARVGFPNAGATAADGLVGASPYVIGVLWGGAGVAIVVSRRLFRLRAARP